MARPGACEILETIAAMKFCAVSLTVAMLGFSPWVFSQSATAPSTPATPSNAALLYGQGGYVTKHHALVVGSTPPDAASLMAPRDVQEEAEAMREPVPTLDTAHSGTATLESFTVVYDREGAPAYGGVAGRTAAGTRVFGKVAADDTNTLALLLDPGTSPIGSTGHVAVGEDGQQVWRA